MGDKFRIRVRVRVRVWVRVRLRVRFNVYIKPIPLSRYPLARKGILFGGPAMEKSLDKRRREMGTYCICITDSLCYKADVNTLL